MPSSLVAGVLIVAVSVVLVRGSEALGQAQSTTPPVGKFPGPCRAWLFPCEESSSSSWVCTTEAAYWGFMFGPQPDCPSLHPNPTTPPPPGECQLVNGTCKFTDSTLKCKTWFDPLYGNKCGPVTEDDSPVKTKLLSAPKGFDQSPPPPPNQLCLPINNSCRWYDPCTSWKGHCTNDNICGSLDEYYASLYGLPPSCTAPPGEVSRDPPGQCAIKKEHCDWYNCTAWMSCFSWYCGTVYEMELYEAGPPPPCPPPPANFTPPARPGECRLNVSTGRCNFFPNTTECVSWIGWCGSSWMCGTDLERAVSRMIPPPPCPPPPRPPVKPGTCTFNVSKGQCSFFPNKSPCNQPIYPPKFDSGSCTNFLRQWTFNPNARRCVEFNYHSCGEDREGYDVFASEQECISTCLRLHQAADGGNEVL